MSAVQKPLTKIVEFETRDVSFRELNVLPDLYQTRAKTDIRFVQAYSRKMAEGNRFPPAVAFRLPDRQLILADGYHRAAARKSLGFTNILTTIRPGTAQDAIIFGIKANFDQDNIREVTKGDRKHAVEIMIRDGTFRQWSNRAISKRCGVSSAFVATLRVGLFGTEKVPIPAMVKHVGDDGIETGRLRPYAYNSTSQPRVYVGGRGCTARINGEVIYLGTNYDDACKKAASLAAKTIVNLAALQRTSNFRAWLTQNRVHGASRGRGKLGGLLIRGDLVFPIHDASQDGVVKGVGLAVLARVESPEINRVILVGYFGSSIGVDVVALASRLPEPVEFMTPEELVAEFGPEGGAAHPHAEADKEGAPHDTADL